MFRGDPAGGALVSEEQGVVQAVGMKRRAGAQPALPAIAGQQRLGRFAQPLAVTRAALGAFAVGRLA